MTNPSVNIYGATIAGLTAAHELALRGFEVRVIEVKQPRKDVPYWVEGWEAGQRIFHPDVFSDAERWFERPSYDVARFMACKSVGFTTGEVVFREVEVPPDGDLPPPEALSDDEEKQLSEVVKLIRERCKKHLDANPSLAPVLDGFALSLKAWFEPVSGGGQRLALTSGTHRALECWMDRVQQEIYRDALGDTREGIQLLRRVRGDKGKADSTQRARAVVSITFGPLFPLQEIELEGLDGPSPWLSPFGAQQIDAAGDCLRRITSDYVNSPWFIVRITTCVAVGVERDGLIQRAQMGARWIEEALRAQIRRTNTSPARDPIIVGRMTTGAADEVGPSNVRWGIEVETTFPCRILFKGDRPDPDGEERLAEVASAVRAMLASQRVQRFPWTVEIIGDDGKPDPGDPRHVFMQAWARRLRSEVELHGWTLHLPKPVPAPKSEKRDQVSGVVLRWGTTSSPAAQRIFTVFPHDWHLRDTLDRIPAAGQGQATPTVWQELARLTRKSSADKEVAQGDRARQIIDLRSPATFFAQLREEPRSFGQLLLRLLRYAVTCAERREKELEGLSFWEYLEGRDNRLRLPRYRYSDQFKRDVGVLCRLVTDADIDEVDARTCGNIAVQLLHDWMRPVPESDRVVAGPLFEGLIKPWREHLRELGVTFEKSQRANDLRLRIDPRGRPVIGPARGEVPVADYHILATDPESAREMTQDLAVGVPAELDAWLDRARWPRHGERLQHRTAIHFFFALGDGEDVEEAHFFVRNFSWCLRAMTAHRLWSRRPVLSEHGFTGVVSVDILSWETPAEDGDLAGRTAWECTHAELAKEVWQRVEPHLRFRVPEGAARPKPRWCLVGDNILYSGSHSRGSPARDLARVAVPLKGDWQHRPGALQVDPDRCHADVLWQSEDGGYLVHWGALVFAGPYLKTSSRTCGPEAACESGRRAVNAVLAHWTATRSPRAAGEAAGADPACFTETWTFSHGDWQSQEQRTLPRPGADEPCALRDPEAHELSELARMKRHDAWCLKHDLPHPWDLLGVETVPAVASWAWTPPGPEAYPGAATPPFDPGEAWSAEAVLRMLRSVREVLEERMRASGGEPGRGPW